MTISTKARSTSGFARFAGIAAFMALFALHAAAFASQGTSIGADLNSNTSEPESEIVRDSGHEAVDIHGTPNSPNRVVFPQTETKRKPSLSVPVIEPTLDDRLESPIFDAKTDAKIATDTEDTKLDNIHETSWRPFDKLPREPRFLKEEPETDDVSQNGASHKFHWKPAILQSLLIQGFQHSYALVVQEKTRRALKGPFFADYWESVKGVRGWSDGNKFFTNYIAHPMQGGMTGFIFVQNHDRAKRQKFGESKQYWKDRFTAFVWSAAWSTNWELGPISQSSIGNVGLYKKQGYVDLVITPTVGTGWLLTEEALDRYVIRHLETKGRGIKMLARTFMNPMRSVANLLRLKEPWYRDRPYGH